MRFLFNYTCRVLSIRCALHPTHRERRRPRPFTCARATRTLEVRAGIRLYLPRATCVTFIAAHTVRAIMLGRRKRHGGTISLSTGVAESPEDPGNWIKCILTHARPRKITVGRAYRPFTLRVILLRVCLERCVRSDEEISNVDQSCRPPN